MPTTINKVSYMNKYVQELLIKDELLPTETLRKTDMSFEYAFDVFQPIFRQVLPTGVELEAPRDCCSEEEQKN